MNSDMENKEELEGLIVRLKSGEYDGGDIMSAWLAIRRLIKIESELATARAEVLAHETIPYHGKVMLERENERLAEALRVAKESGASIAAYNCTITKELETLKATGFNVQDVVDIVNKQPTMRCDLIMKHNLISDLNQLDQSDKKDGEQ